MKHAPTDPDEIRRIKLAIKRMRSTARDMRKDPIVSSIAVGMVLDDATALELVLTWGSYGGKMPYPITPQAREIIDLLELGDRVHPAYDFKQYQKRSSAPRRNIRKSDDDGSGFAGVFWSPTTQRQLKEANSESLRPQNHGAELPEG